MKKTFLLLLIVLVAFTGLYAGGQKEGDKPMRITYVTPLIGHPVWLVSEEGFKAAEKEFGFEGAWVGPNGISVNEMIEQIELAIASKVDGIISMALNPEAFGPVLKKAAEAGIPVVLVNSDAPDSERLAFIGTGEINLGTVGAQGIINILGGETPRVATMQSTMDARVANMELKGYFDELKKQDSSTEILVRESNESDMLVAVDKWNTILDTYPDVNVFISVCGEGGPAAAKVIEERDLVGKIVNIAIDDMAETIAGVKTGSVTAFMTQNFYKMGYLGAKLIVDYAKSGTVPNEKIIDAGTIFVDADLLDSYKEKMKE